MWSFTIDNKKSDESLEPFRVPTTKLEKYAGLFLWETLVGTKIKRKKNRIRKIWKT
jgi:endonuclease G